MGIDLTTEVKEALRQIIFSPQRGENDPENFAYKLLRNLSLQQTDGFYIPLQTQKPSDFWENDQQVEAAEAQDIIRRVIRDFAEFLPQPSSYGKEQVVRELLANFCREIIKDCKELAFKAISGSIKKNEVRISRHNSGLLGRNKGFEISGTIDGLSEVVHCFIGQDSANGVNMVSSSRSGFRSQVFVKNLSPDVSKKLEELYQLGVESKPVLAKS